MAINNPPFVSGRVHRGGELRLYPAISSFHPPYGRLIGRMMRRTGPSRPEMVEGDSPV